MSFTLNVARIEYPSHVGMLDVVQIHSDHIGRLGGLDEVDLKRIPAAGMEVRLVKKLGSSE
jgi:hypothetical protein